MSFHRRGSVNRLRNSLSRNRSLRTETLEARRVLAAAIESGLWENVADDAIPSEQVEVRALDFDLFQLDHGKLETILNLAPNEDTSFDELPLISVPRPNGELATFRFVSSPIMAPELAAQFPEINTYAGAGIDDPAATLRFDLTPAGFHAQVLSPNGSFYVDPAARGSDFYASYFAAGVFDVSELQGLEPDHVVSSDGSSGDAEPARSDSGSDSDNDSGSGSRLGSRSGSELRIYRTAVAATGEYTSFHGGTVVLGQAAIVTAMNRVTGIYENELSIAFELVANNSSLVFTDPNTDPFTNNNGGAMLGENQTVVDSRIGNANYDIGHVFSTGGGGVARLGSVGIDGIKAMGVTGLPAPTNDAFYVDYVSHEIGHQFGGNHTFNGDSGACAGNGNGSTAMEPGSGSTIQAYAGICGNDDLQANSDPYFHSASFDEMIAHVDGRIPNVGTRRPTGNSIPIVSAGQDYAIPAQTPFVLTAVGVDADIAQQLTYNWEQRDVGPQQDVNGGDNGLSPIFRSWNPTTSPSRYFPRLSDLAANGTAIGETLPTTNRTLNFRATIRDNFIGGGGVNTDDARLQVVDTGAPFVVLTPNTSVTWDGLSQQTITWDVAGTTAAPISTPQVSIYFSADGGLTYPFTVVENVPNTGSANVFIPNVDTTLGRVMVRGANNVFFDISDADITVNAVPIDIQLDSGTAQYTENRPAIPVSPNARVVVAGNLAGLSIDVAIAQGKQVGDQLSVLASGSITVAAGSVSYNALTIGTYAKSGDAIAMRLNSNADASATEALLRAIGFENTTDSPTNTQRTVEFVFGSTITASRAIDVTPLNDPPTIADAQIPAILEDGLTPKGARIADFMAGKFSDPDSGSFIAGLAIINNPLNATEGTWYHSNNGTTWSTIGSVNDSDKSLVVGAGSRIGFLPAPNYFGNPTPLTVRALDNSYAGGYSNATTGNDVFLNAAERSPAGSVSLNVGQVNITVTNVNDSPVANQSLISINLLQDEPIDRIFETSLFTDIDSPSLAYSLRGASGNQLPAWMSFNTSTRAVAGTPRNRDVGSYSLVLRATDSDLATADIPLIVNVANVNDAPINLKLTGSTVLENRSNVVIGDLFANDPDPGDLVFWSTSDTRFIVRDNSLVLTAPLDYEVAQTVNLILTATDTGVPFASSQLAVTLKVIDENEFFPDLSGQTISIPDGTAAGTVLTTLSAPDGDTLQTVRFRLKSGDTNSFNLNSTTGVLSLAADANVANKSSYLVFIEAYDNGEPLKARTSQFAVNVTRINKFSPTIPSTQSISFRENLPAGVAVGTVVAQDQDGDPLRFTITNEVAGQEGWLTVDAGTGELRTTAAAAYDFEAPSPHVIEVQVTEGVAPFRSATGTVTLSIINVNDPPTAISDFSIPTSQMGYPTNGDFTVTDQDLAASYTLATTDARFEIRNGALSLRPNVFFDDALGGTTTNVMLTVTDVVDPTSFASLPARINILANPSPWQNRLLQFDVNRTGNVTASDVLLVVNAINVSGGQATVLSRPRTLAERSLPDIDVSGDNILTALDALLVVNYVNANPSGEGEGSRAEPLPAANDQLWISAFTALEEETKRRRRG